MPYPKRAVTVTVEVPDVVEERALERAIDVGDPDLFEEFVHEQLLLDVELRYDLDPDGERLRSPVS